jgi:hypothetical protein
MEVRDAGYTIYLQGHRRTRRRELWRGAGSRSSRRGAHAAAAAKALVEPLRKAEKLVEVFRPGAGQTAEDVGEEFLKRLAQAADHSREAVEASAEVLRKSPGAVIASKELFTPDKLLRGSAGNAGLVPQELAELMAGKEYSSFKSFKRAFWKNMSRTKYAEEFGPRQLARMRNRKSPIVDESQYWGEFRKHYELHHMTPINRGGSVYDLCNLLICTPRFHKEVLDKVYHFKP